MRAKKNYRMTAPELYAMVVPSYYHLKPDDITAIVEAPTYEEARLLIVNGYYGQKYADDFAEIRFVEKMYTELVEHIFELAGRKNHTQLHRSMRCCTAKSMKLHVLHQLSREYAMESQQQN